jgi:DNA-binding MarR family transcriptional regulator
MSPNQPDTQPNQSIDQIDKTVHSPTRLKILIVLAAVVNADFVFLANATGLTRGNLSANLRKLEEAGYLTIEKGYQGRVSRTLIQLTAEGRRALQTYNEHMRAVLDDLQGHIG